MPKNVRNFWCTLRVDGRDSELASGPVAKNGGFACRIMIRRDGDVDHAVTINGIANPDGTLEIRCAGFDDVGNAVGRFVVEGRR